MTEPEPAAGTTTSATGRRVWLGVGAVLTVTALALGAMGVTSAGWVALHPMSAETTIERQSYARPAARVDTYVDFGAVALSGTDADRVDVRREVTWSGHEPEVDETWTGDTFAVDVDCPNGFPHWLSDVCSVDYSARMPAAADVEVDTATGPIDVRHLDGEMELTATTGSITIDDAGGPLSARVTTGDITGSDLRSPQVDAETGTGHIELSFTEAPDRVTAVVSTGNVAIEVPRAGGPYHVDVQTSTGEQRVDVAQDPEADPGRVIDVTATTGDVHIRYSNGSR